MSIKNIIVSTFAIAVFGTVALAQGGQPNQQKQPMPGGGGMGDKGPGMMGRGGMGGGGMRGPGMGGGMMGGPGRIDFNRLNLTDAQKQRIQSLMDSNEKSREATKAQFEEMGKLNRLKREGLLTSDQGTRLTSLEAQMKTSAEKMHNDLLAVLTPEQKTLLDQMKNERGGMMRDGQQQRRGPGGQQGPGGRQGGPMGGGNQPPQPPPTNDN